MILPQARRSKFRLLGQGNIPGVRVGVDTPLSGEPPSPVVGFDRTPTSCHQLRRRDASLSSQQPSESPSAYLSSNMSGPSSRWGPSLLPSTPGVNNYPRERGPTGPSYSTSPSPGVDDIVLAELARGDVESSRNKYPRERGPTGPAYSTSPSPS